MKTNRELLFELLVPPTKAELKAVGGNKKKYDRGKRAINTVKAIKEIGKHLYVDIWKLEGFDKAKQWQDIIDAITLSQNPDDFGIVLLGRGETKKKVISWLKLGAKFQKITGFAVGRTVFFDPLVELKEKKITRKQAVDKIAKEFGFFVNLWLKEKGIKLE
jgi:myo-inositol catabolism protein IolC